MIVGLPEALGSATLFGLSIVAMHWSLRFVGEERRPDPLYEWLKHMTEPIDRKTEPTDRKTRRWFRDKDNVETIELEQLSATAAQAPLTNKIPPTGARDHVPFELVATTEEAAAASLRLRDRFRRGMAKTREVLNRDVTEVLGGGVVSETLDQLEEVLIRSDVGVAAATELRAQMEAVEGLNSDNIGEEVRRHMRALLKDSDRRLRLNPGSLSVWLVVGVNGTGKTTTIAKLAKLAQSQGFSVLLAAADTFRAAAVEQLQTWGDRLEIEVISQAAGADPGAVVFDAVAAAKARSVDLLIVDTAGRLQNRKPLMDELGKVTRVIQREQGVLTETLLVLDATTGQNGVVQAAGFRETSNVTGLVIAKLDGTARGGIAFAVERDLGIPVKAVGLGETVDDLAPFDPDAFVAALFD